MGSRSCCLPALRAPRWSSVVPRRCSALVLGPASEAQRCAGRQPPRPTVCSRYWWARARPARGPRRRRAEGESDLSLFPGGEAGPCSSLARLRATGFLRSRMCPASRVGPERLVHVAYRILKLLPLSSPHQRAHPFLVPVNAPAVVSSAVLWALCAGSPAARSQPGQRWSDAVSTPVDGASPCQGGHVHPTCPADPQPLASGEPQRCGR